MPTAEDRQLAHQFDPLLRELLTFGLVAKDLDGDSVRWVLTEEVQRRLTSLDRPAPDQSSMFFVGHRCDRCRDHTVTRRIADARLCARCVAEVAVDVGAEERLA